MRKIQRFLTVVVMVLGAAVLASETSAQDRALIVTNEFYQNQPRLRGARVVGELDRDLRAAGFAVRQVSNTRTNVTESEAADLWEWLDQADKLIIVVSGHVVSVGGQPWLLHTDAGSPNAFTIGQSAMPLQPLFSFAAQRQGDAVIALADDDSALKLGDGVTKGYRPDVIPQGVTVLTGSPVQVAGFISNELLKPGRSLAESVKQLPDGLRVSGYIPLSRGFIAAETVVVTQAPREDPDTQERAYWQRVRTQDSQIGYDRYLSRYPNGLFAAEARRRSAEFDITPQERARQDEEALGLTRDQKRAIQRNLTLIGFDTQGVDGIFGRLTRSAISEWQRAIGAPVTAFLNAAQIKRIETAATERADELRHEAEQKRLEEERRDRQFWNDTGADGTEDGLRRYLRRYPDGVFAEQAQQGLDEIERERRRQSRKAERDAWDRAVMQGTVESYQEYLETYPDGQFQQEARARIERLGNPETPAEEIAAAKQEEDRMGLNGFTRRLIEAQLSREQLEPGLVDGRFTDDTRRALRRFQRANSLPVTGYVSRSTVVRLMAGAIEN